MKKVSKKTNLDPEDWEWIKARMKARRLSTAAVIREAIALAIAAEAAGLKPSER